MSTVFTYFCVLVVFGVGGADDDLNLHQNDVHSRLLCQSGQSFPGSDYYAALKVSLHIYNLCSNFIFSSLVISLFLVDFDWASVT